MPNTGFNFTTKAATGFEGEIKLIEETWGVKLDAPRPEARINQRIEAFDEWVQNVPRPDFAAIFLHAPADEWDTLIAAELEKEKHWAVVSAVHDLKLRFAQQIRRMRESGAQFDWILDQIETKKMAATFVKSVKALGNVRDFETALDTKPRDTLAVRKAGRALAALTHLVPSDHDAPNEERQALAQVRTCAVLARPTRDFEPLVRHDYTSGFKYTEDTWEPEEYEAQAVAKDTARRSDTTDFLLDLARGDVENFELAPATSFNEVRQRQKHLIGIGEITVVDMGRGTAATEEDRRRARARAIAQMNQSMRPRRLDPDA